MMHDLHCHLDFMANACEVAYDARRDGCLLFANTVLPDHYQRICEDFAALDNVRVGIGFHPWYVEGSAGGMQMAESDERRCAVARALLEDSSLRYVGEIGLDFGKRHIQTRAAQLKVFQGILEAVGCVEGRVLSLHSVKASTAVMDEIDRYDVLGVATCVFHWFSGSVPELYRAIESGYYFSIGKRMVQTKRGAEYLKVIPLDRMLLETDAPPQEGEPYSYDLMRGELQETLECIQMIKGSAAASVIHANSEAVLR